MGGRHSLKQGGILAEILGSRIPKINKTDRKSMMEVPNLEF
jgi:hypothetical protein